jgi:hypothetical protein
VERPNTVPGLLDKRREISGKIEHYQRLLNELIVDLDHLDHTIRFFDRIATWRWRSRSNSRHAIRRSGARCSASSWAP